MDNPTKPNGPKTLANRLRLEASQTQPAFSESLHDRVLRAVESCKMVEPLLPEAETRWNHQRVALTAAAVLVVGTLTFLWQGNHSGSPMNEPIVTVSGEDPESLGLATDISANPVVDIGLLVDSTVTDQRWAYLDHDAQLAASLLLDQLPSSITWPEESTHIGR